MNSSYSARSLAKNLLRAICFLLHHILPSRRQTSRLWSLLEMAWSLSRISTRFRSSSTLHLLIYTLILISRHWPPSIFQRLRVLPLEALGRVLIRTEPNRQRQLSAIHFLATPGFFLPFLNGRGVPISYLTWPRKPAGAIYRFSRFGSQQFGLVFHRWKFFCSVGLFTIYFKVCMSGAMTIQGSGIYL